MPEPYQSLPQAMEAIKTTAFKDPQELFKFAETLDARADPTRPNVMLYSGPLEQSFSVLTGMKMANDLAKTLAQDHAGPNDGIAIIDNTNRAQLMVTDAFKDKCLELTKANMTDDRFAQECVKLMKPAIANDPQAVSEAAKALQEEAARNPAEMQKASNTLLYDGGKGPWAQASADFAASAAGKNIVVVLPEGAIERVFGATELPMLVDNELKAGQGKGTTLDGKPMAEFAQQFGAKDGHEKVFQALKDLSKEANNHLFSKLEANEQGVLTLKPVMSKEFQEKQGLANNTELAKGLDLAMNGMYQGLRAEKAIPGLEALNERTTELKAASQLKEAARQDPTLAQDARRAALQGVGKHLQPGGALPADTIRTAAGQAAPVQPFQGTIEKVDRAKGTVEIKVDDGHSRLKSAVVNLSEQPGLVNPAVGDRVAATVENGKVKLDVTAQAQPFQRAEVPGQAAQRDILGQQRRERYTTPLLSEPVPRSFNVKAAESLAKETDKGILKGHGDFGQVLDAYKKVSQAVEGQDKARQAKSPADEAKNRREANRQCTALVKEADKWLAAHGGKTDGDDIHALKEQKCHELKADALVMKAHLDRAEVHALQEERKKSLLLGKASPESEAFGRQADADLLVASKGYTRAGEGTSVVGLVKDENLAVAHVFKSITGESDQTGMAKGSGAVREVLAFKVCEAIANGGGPDFGWPASSFAEMKGVTGDIEKGVLIEGISGKQLNPAKDGALQKEVPAGEVQKLLMCNLLLGQHDIKWDNAMLQGTGADQKLRPIDGGAAFPDKDALMTTVVDWQKKNSNVPGNILLDKMDASFKGEQIEAAGQKLDPKLCEQICAIKPAELEKVATQAVAEAAKFGVDKEVIEHAREGFGNAMKSLKGMQKMLEQNKDLTLGEFVEKHNKETLSQLVSPQEQKAWENKQKAEYNALAGDKDLKELMKPLGELKMDPVDLYKDFTNKSAQNQLAEIKEMAKRTEGGGKGLAWLGGPDGPEGAQKRSIQKGVTPDRMLPAVKTAVDIYNKQEPDHAAFQKTVQSATHQQVSHQKVGMHR